MSDQDNTDAEVVSVEVNCLGGLEVNYLRGQVEHGNEYGCLACAQMYEEEERFLNQAIREIREDSSEWALDQAARIVESQRSPRDEYESALVAYCTWDIDAFAATGQGRINGYLQQYHATAPFVLAGTVCEWCPNDQNCQFRITINPALWNPACWWQPDPMLANGEEWIQGIFDFMDLAPNITQEGTFYNKPYRRRIVNQGLIFRNKQLEAAISEIVADYNPGRWAERRGAEVNTMYKIKDKKVKPVDRDQGDGAAPGGRRDWYEISQARDTPQEHVGEFKGYVIPRFADIPRGSRLTEENLKKLDNAQGLRPVERRYLEEVLTAREKAIAFDWTHCGVFHEDVSPPIMLNVIEHNA